MEYVQKDSIRMFNVRKIVMKNNYFGFPIGLPVAVVTFQSGGSSCPEPLPFSSLAGLAVSGNMAIRADWSLVEVDHSYSQNIVDKVDIDTTILLMPCACQDVPIGGNQTNVIACLPLHDEKLILFFLGPHLQESNDEIKMLWRGKNSVAKCCLLL